MLSVIVETVRFQLQDGRIIVKFLAKKFFEQLAVLKIIRIGLFLTYEHHVNCGVRPKIPRYGCFELFVDINWQTDAKVDDVF